MWLSSIWNVASGTGKLILQFYSTLIILNGYMWLLVTILDSLENLVVAPVCDRKHSPSTETVPMGQKVGLRGNKTDVLPFMTTWYTKSNSNLEEIIPIHKSTQVPLNISYINVFSKSPNLYTIFQESNQCRKQGNKASRQMDIKDWKVTNNPTMP